ncbi:unnamed protein product [Cochlearia groenlandica]
MFSPKNHEFDQTCKAKVPFSWELKPGVSRKNDKSGRDQIQWKLTPPPCPHVDYNEEVPQSPNVVCPFTPTNLSSFRKKDVDPFLEAYMNCLKHSPIRISSVERRNARADNQDCYAKKKKSKIKPFLLWIWSKYSCKFGTDGWCNKASRFCKPKSNERIDSNK